MQKDEKSEKKQTVKKAKPKTKTKPKMKPKKKAIKKEVDDITFEERVFQNDGKENDISGQTKYPKKGLVFASILLVALVVVTVLVIKNKNFSFMEKIKVELKETTQAPVEVKSDTNESEVVNEPSSKEKVDISTLESILPHYDSDIYSEAAMYSYDMDTLNEVKNEIEALQRDETYIATIEDGKRDVLINNKKMLDNYIDEYSYDDMMEYRKTVNRNYMDEIINGAKEKSGSYYHSDFIAVSLFSAAVDKGFYYEVPSSFFKKVIIKKNAFDKMKVGEKGSISLPTGKDGSAAATKVTKEDDSSVSYIDASGVKKILQIAEKSDTEYVLIDSDNGAFVVVPYFTKDVSIPKNARIGHGKSVEYIAYNCLKYPVELNFEVYVKAEEIVNKTSSNSMLNGQFINSNKQVWDDKGFLISLVYFE